MREVEALGHDADNRGRRSVDIDSGTDDVYPPGEIACPQPVVEDHDGRRSGSLVRVFEIAPEYRRHPEQPECVRGDLPGREIARARAGGPEHNATAGHHSGDVVERV